MLQGGLNQFSNTFTSPMESASLPISTSRRFLTSTVTPEQLLHESDLCVKCGLCLPHCPTYRITQDEGDSPRGRIALIQALLCGQLQSTPRLHAHLDRCLGCRACEKACPSAVQYSRLIDGVRAIRFQQHPAARQWLYRKALGLLTRPRLLSIGARLLRLLPRRRSAAPPFLHSRLQRLIGLCPNFSRPTRWQTTYPPAGECAGRVALFLGCISRFSDQAALLSARRLLNRLGWEVIVPPRQGCCGALFQHAGEPATAQKLNTQNQAAFDDQPFEAILTIASGCGAHIKEYGALPAPIVDISGFLNQHPWPESIALKPLPQTVAVHDPCSLQTADAVYPLLNRIPEIELISLADNALCCGAGGINLITEPQMADALLTPKLASLQHCQATILLTSNTSCALHFAAGIRRAGLEIEVLHPVQLLERQLRP